MQSGADTLSLGRARSRLCTMVKWFWQRPQAGRVLAVKSRDARSQTTKIDFAELAPGITTFLGQAAYLQLGYFETLSQLITATPALEQKESLSRAAGAAYIKHRDLVALIRDRGDDPTATMLPFREHLDDFRRATHGRRTEETMLSVHITAGMLDDFYLSLAHSYGATGARVAKILQADDDRDAIVEILGAKIAADPEWRALLAVWGRRLVGDTLLVARAALSSGGALDREDEELVEPVFTGLMAGHAKRMDAMGLSA